MSILEPLTHKEEIETLLNEAERIHKSAIKELEKQNTDFEEMFKAMKETLPESISQIRFSKTLKNPT